MPFPNNFKIYTIINKLKNITSRMPFINRVSSGRQLISAMSYNNFCINKKKHMTVPWKAG